MEDWRRQKLARGRHAPIEGVRTAEVAQLISQGSGKRERIGDAPPSWWAAYEGHDGPYEVKYTQGMRLTVRWRRADGWVWTVVAARGRRGGWDVDRTSARRRAERAAQYVLATAAWEEQEWARRAGIIEDDQTEADEEAL